MSSGHVGRACKPIKPDGKVLEDCPKKMAILLMICVCSGCPQLTLGLIILSAVSGFLLWKWWREQMSMFNGVRKAASVHSQFLDDGTQLLINC